jgi:hypothetical protein
LQITYKSGAPSVVQEDRNQLVQGQECVAGGPEPPTRATH